MRPFAGLHRVGWDENQQPDFEPCVVLDLASQTELLIATPDGDLTVVGVETVEWGVIRDGKRYVTGGWPASDDFYAAMREGEA